jgi:hypothetical protein
MGNTRFLSYLHAVEKYVERRRGHKEKYTDNPINDD